MPRKQYGPGHWPPPKPASFEFSPHTKGWAKWYKGQTRVVALKTMDRAAVRAAWKKRTAEIDADLAADAVAVQKLKAVGGYTVREAAAVFYEYLDLRASTGRPDGWLSPFTVADYRRWVNDFGRFVGPDRLVTDLSQPDFTGYAGTLEANSPSTVSRAVAYIQAFFSYCKDEGVIPTVPEYGRHFVKPPTQEHRDTRLAVAKSYNPADIRAAYDLARPDEKCWIVLGVCAAFDNADLAHLTKDVLDRKAGVIDFRRRKRGKVRRVIPMPAEFWALLDKYQRPESIDPAHADRVFLTPTGLPLQRQKEGKAGQLNPIDYVSMRFVRLLIGAGLRPKMPRRRDKGFRDLPRRVKAKGVAGGQGFRGLRTTFANLVPPGYGEEREIIMGHARGTILLDNYLEKVGLERLKHVVSHVYKTVFTSPQQQGGSSGSSAGASPDSS